MGALLYHWSYLVVSGAVTLDQFRTKVKPKEQITAHNLFYGS
jgi:hypothetical protein